MEKRRPSSPFWTKFLLVGVVLAFYIPLLVMIFESFKVKIDDESWQLSLKWYFELFQDEALMEALVRSFWIAIGSSVLSCVIGTLTALSIGKYAFRFQTALSSLAFVSLMIPELVFALALLSWFSTLSIHLGYDTVIYSHTTFCIAFVSMTVTARLNTLDAYLDEASHDLGANAFQTLFQVILPVLKPAVIAGFLLSFLLSFDDFLITFYTSGPGTDTLPVKLYSSMKMGLSPKLHALAVLMMLISVVLISLLTRIKSVTEFLSAEEN